MAIRSLSKIPDIGRQKGPDGLLHPDVIADSYLHTQHRSAWSQGLDVRPSSETFELGRPISSHRSRHDIFGGLPTATKPFAMKVQAVTRLCESVVRLAARATGRTPLVFLPGQYVNLRIPGTDQWRSYSMANAPSDAGFDHEFLVRLLEDGVMSKYLVDRAIAGDTIEARGPFGTFYLRESTKPVLMIAGGTGLAPMAAMLRSMVAKKHARAVTLCFGVTRPADLFYLDELEALRGSLPCLDPRIAIMQGDAGGHVSSVATDLVLQEDVSERDLYLCGPPAMTDQARAIVAAQGADTSSIFVERFVAVEGAQSIVPTPSAKRFAGGSSAYPGAVS